jgi:hypothetical protein
MGAGGATWDSAGTLTLGSGNTFDVADATEGLADDPYQHGWWAYTPSATQILTLDTFASTYTTGDWPHADTDITVYVGDVTDGIEVDYDDYDDDAYVGEGIYLSRYTFTAQAGTTYYVRVGNWWGVGQYAEDSSLITYALTASATTLTTSPWIDPGDDPDNYLIISDGTMRAANPNPFFRYEGVSPAAWTLQVIRGAQARVADYSIQSVFDGPSTLGGVDCAIAHAGNGESPFIGQTWEEDEVCAPLATGEAEPRGSAFETTRAVTHSEPGEFVSGFTTAGMSGPAYGAWFLPVRDNLGPTGTVDLGIDPTDYGYPADAELEWEYDYPELLGIEWADGDPVSIDDGAPYANKWGLNYTLFGTWVDGWSTPWQLGSFPIEVPIPVTEDRPEMLWSYGAGIEGETGVDAEDVWHPMPDSEGWDDHGWTDSYEGGGENPATSDAMVAAWPDATGMAVGESDARFARPAVKFILQARRFRFIYTDVTDDTPPRRGWPSNPGFTTPANGWGRRPNIQHGPRGWGAIT